MRNIVKGPEPQSLREHRERTHSNYNNYVEKQELREALVREQRGLCCYCLCRIVPIELEMKIEHWRSQRRYPAEQLIYANLFAACKGGEGANRDGERDVDQHCDTFKGSRDLSLLYVTGKAVKLTESAPKEEGGDGECTPENGAA